MVTKGNRNHQRFACEKNVSLKDFAETLEPSLSPAVPADLQLLPALLGHTHRQCCYCNTKGKDERGLRTCNVDEIVPCGQGGRYNQVNRVPACGQCNSSKGAKTGAKLDEWLRDRVEAGTMTEQHRRTLRTYMRNNAKYIFSQTILDHHAEVELIVQQAIQWKIRAIHCAASKAMAASPLCGLAENAPKRPRISSDENIYG